MQYVSTSSSTEPYVVSSKGAAQLTQHNIDMTLGKFNQNVSYPSNNFILNVFLAASNELVFINFYAEWCRFSNILQPIFDEAADKLKEAFPEVGKVIMGKVDCDKERKCIKT